MTSQSISFKAWGEIPGYVIDELDESLLAQLAESPLGDEKKIDVYLAKYASEGADATDPQLIKALEVICRKLSVQRMVRVSYDKEWKMAVEKQPLDRKWWPLMLFLLLTIPGAEGAPEDQIGRALKQVNAALIGIDVAKALDVTEVALANLGELAGQRLDELTR